MNTLPSRASALAGPVILAALVLAGCGGAGGASSGGPGGGGPSPALSGEPLATARVLVDAETGATTVFPLSGDSGRAVLAGNSIEIAPDRLVEDPGERTRRLLRVRYTNRLNEDVGEPNGVEIGVRSIRPLAAPSQDLSSQRTFYGYAGTGTAGSLNSSVAQATLNGPTGLATDGTSNSLFISEDGSVRRISDGQVTTIGSGLGTVGDLVYHEGYIYFTVTSNHTLCRIPAEGGPVEVIAGAAGQAGSANGSGATARFSSPRGLCLLRQNGFWRLAVADFGNNQVRLVDSFDSFPDVTSLLNDTSGVADVVGFNDGASNTLFAGETPMVAATSSTGNFVQIHRLSDGSVRLIGSGIAGSADGFSNVCTFNQPWGITAMGKTLVISEAATGRVRQLALVPGANPMEANAWYVSRYNTPTTPGAANGPGLTAQTGGRLGLLYWNLDLYFADSTRNFIRRISATEGWRPVIDGGGWTAGSGEILVANQDFRRSFAAGGTVLEEESVYSRASLFAGDSASFDLVVSIPAGVRAFEFLVTVSAAAAGDSALSSGLGASSPDVIMQTIAGNPNESGWLDGAGTQVRLTSPELGAVDERGLVYFVDVQPSGIDRIRVLEPSTGRVGTIVGTSLTANNIIASGTGAQAAFPVITGLAMMRKTGRLYFSTPAGIFVAWSTLPALSLFDFDAYVTASNWQVKLISGDLVATGDVNGVGLAARYLSPKVVLADSISSIFVVDGAHRIRRLRIQDTAAPDLSSSYEVILFSGSTTSGSANGGSSIARFNTIVGMAPLNSGSFAVADSGNQLVRVLTQSGTASTLAGGAGIAGYTDGSGTGARFMGIAGIASDKFGLLYVLEGTRIRRVTPGGEVRTVLNGTTFRDGAGAVAGFSNARSISTGPNGELMVTDLHSVRRVSRIIRNNQTGP